MLVACVQMNSGTDMVANMAAASGFVREAAARGAGFVALPENAVLMGADEIYSSQLKSCDEYMKIEAESPIFRAVGSEMESWHANSPSNKGIKCFSESEHPAVSFFAQLAQELNICLLLGSVAVKADEASHKLKNRSLLFAADGSVAARYDKIHLFDVDIGSADSSGGAYRESDKFSAGDKVVVAETAFARVGLSVCYDVRFPLLYQKLARAGAEILCVPAAFTRLTGAAHWHVLLRARAIETGCYVIAPAQCGEHAGGRQTFGHAMIINPWGEIIAEAATAPCIIYADIDRGLVRSARRKIPAWKYD